ncbi:MAG TPA: ADP-ribosyltransferase domain-containing protein [Streptosporangiaceae bacterium]
MPSSGTPTATPTPRRPRSRRADRVSTGLAKLPPRPGTTYRGVGFSSDIAKNYQEGTVVTERAFTSTSTDASVATGAFDGNTLMTVTGHSGRDIAPFSHYPESEILYEKGTQFQVIRNAFDPAIGKTVIQMREVG